jgi:GGDEF domain-containing protein
MSQLHRAQALLSLAPGVAAPECTQEATDQMVRIVRWARDFLAKPHPKLGREGPVCPWVEESLSSDLFFVTSERTVPLERDRIRSLIVAHRDAFLSMEPRTGRTSLLKTILVLFPDVGAEAAPDVIDSLQLELKPQFVEEGLMFGQFHPRCEVPGMRNPAFRPLQSPVAMLVIRHMVLTDLLFLLDDEAYLEAYLRRFGQSAYDQVVTHVSEHRDSLTPRQAALLIALIRRHAGKYRMRQPTHSALTGLQDLDYFMQRLAADLKTAANLTRALFWISVDNLADLTLKHGETARDLAQWHVARLMRATVGVDNLMARIDDREFLILAEVNEMFAHELSQKIRQKILEEPFLAEGAQFQLEASVGLAVSGSGQTRSDAKGFVAEARNNSQPPRVA